MDYLASGRHDMLGMNDVFPIFCASCTTKALEERTSAVGVSPAAAPLFDPHALNVSGGFRDNSTGGVYFIFMQQHGWGILNRPAAAAVSAVVATAAAVWRRRHHGSATFCYQQVDGCSVIYRAGPGGLVVLGKHDGGFPSPTVEFNRSYAIR